MKNIFFKKLVGSNAVSSLLFFLFFFLVLFFLIIGFIYETVIVKAINSFYSRQKSDQSREFYTVHPSA